MLPVTTTRGRLVAHRRAARGLSQEDLARLVPCSVRTVQRIEGDEPICISPHIVEALHEHLGMPRWELASAKRPAGRF